MRSPLSLKTEQAQPSQPSLIREMLQSLNHLYCPPWACSRSPMSLWHWGALNWAQHSRYDLARAEQRGRITSLDLLPMLFLMHPRVLLAHGQLSGHQFLLPRSCLPAGQPQPMLVPGVFFPRCRICICFCWTLGSSPLPVSPPCQGPSEELAAQQTPTSYNHSSCFFHGFLWSYKVDTLLGASINSSCKIRVEKETVPLLKTRSSFPPFRSC